MKKTTIIVLNIVLFFLICILGLNLTVRPIMLDAVVKGGVGHPAAVRLMDVVFQNFPAASVGQLGQIQTKLENERALKEMTGIYMDSAINAAVDKRPMPAIDMLDQINSMAGEALADIEGVMGGGTDHELRQQLIKVSGEISDTIYDYVQAILDGSGPVRHLITAYWLLASAGCRIVSGIGIILAFGILFLLKKGPLSVMAACKWSILLSGLCLGVCIPLLISNLWPVLVNRFLGGRGGAINSSILRNTGLSIMDAGIIFSIAAALHKHHHVS